MRRRLMLRNASIARILYPLVAGVMQRAFQITTSETGHIKMYNSARQTGAKYANLRNVVAYYVNNTYEQMNCPLWFELKAGQECVFEALHKPSNVQLSLYVANSTSAYKTMDSSDNTISFTVESDVEVGCVGLYTTAAIAAGTTNEFDISLTVDGRRYF